MERSPVPEENDSQETDENGEPKPKSEGKRLREQNDALRAELRQTKAALTLSRTRLGHLNEKQQRAVLNNLGDAELTDDSFVAAAKELGYEPETDTPSVPPANGQSDTSTTDAPPSDEVPDPDLPVELSHYQRIEQAARAGAGGQVDGRDFELALKNAKTQGEVEAIIKRQGSSVGLLHEQDID